MEGVEVLKSNKGQFLTYHNYLGSIEYNIHDELYFGKLLELTDLVSYEGKTIEDLKKAFEEAVDDYILIDKKSLF
jgi:predicted HicB family RNase H-like nuclease